MDISIPSIAFPLTRIVDRRPEPPQGPKPAPAEPLMMADAAPSPGWLTDIADRVKDKVGSKLDHYADVTERWVDRRLDVIDRHLGRNSAPGATIPPASTPTGAHVPNPQPPEHPSNPPVAETSPNPPAAPSSPPASWGKPLPNIALEPKQTGHRYRSTNPISGNKGDVWTVAIPRSELSEATHALIATTTSGRFTMALYRPGANGVDPSPVAARSARSHNPDAPRLRIVVPPPAPGEERVFVVMRAQTDFANWKLEMRPHKAVEPKPVVRASMPPSMTISPA